MEKWQWTALLLCTFGIFTEFQPSEPFFVEFAIEHRGFSVDQLVHEVLPSTAYGSLLSLSIFLLITDFLRYKPVIIIGAIASLGAWAIPIWAYDNNRNAEIRQIVRSVALSSEIAYMTYMYSNVERKNFKAVTSYIHSALHTGQFFAGLVAQVLVSTDTMNYYQLNYLSLGGAVAALFVALWLPKPKRSLYFYPRASIVSTNVAEMMRIQYAATQRENAKETTGDDSESIQQPVEPEPTKIRFPNRVKKAFRRFSRDFKEAYGNRHVLKWSLWWAVAMGVYLQVQLFSEGLWRYIEEDTHQDVYNGAVHSAHGLLTAALSIGVAFIKFPFVKWGEVYLSGISFLQAAILIIMAQTYDLYIVYICYIAFVTLFEIMIIVVTAEVAGGIKDDSEAFIFGLNTIVAYLIQAVMSYAMVFGPEGEKRMTIRDVFLVYALYCAVLGLLFIVLAVQNRNKTYNIESRFEVEAANSNNSDNNDSSINNNNNNNNNINNNVGIQRSIEA